MIESSYFYALASVLLFSASSLAYRHFAVSVSTLWINAFKSTIAFGAFCSIFALQGFRGSWESQSALLALVLSGIIGLNVGDFFMLKAFKKIGSARTFILFRVQPFYFVALAFFVDGHVPVFKQWMALLFMTACVWALAWEQLQNERKNSTSPHRSLSGLGDALLATSLDSVGIFLTKFAMTQSPEIGTIEANVLRTFGSVTGFWVLSRWIDLQFIARFLSLTTRARVAVVAGSFAGTFGALWCWLMAIRSGELALITAIGGIGPVSTALFESILFKAPFTKALWVGLVLSTIGFLLVI